MLSAFSQRRWGPLADDGKLFLLIHSRPRKVAYLALLVRAASTSVVRDYITLCSVFSIPPTMHSFLESYLRCARTAPWHAMVANE